MRFGRDGCFQPTPEGAASTNRRLCRRLLRLPPRLIAALLALLFLTLTVLAHADTSYAYDEDGRMG